MRKLFALAFTLVSFEAFAADTSVPNMTAGSAMSDTDLIYCAQSGGTTDRKCTGAQVKTYAITSAVRATTTTSEALANSDQGKLVTFSNAAAIAATIAQAGGGGNFTAGWFTSLQNLGAGTVTLTPTTSTIDGRTSVVLLTGQGIDLYSDGSNYFTMRGQTDAPRPDYVANQWYMQPGVTRTVSTGQAHGTGLISCKFAYYPVSVTIKALAVAINTAGSSNLQLALYKESGGGPGVLLNSTGNIADNVTSTVSGALGGNVLVGPGTTNGARIWHCTMVNDGTVILVGEDNNSTGSAEFVGSQTLTSVMQGTSGQSNTVGVRCTSGCTGGTPTFGSWPATLIGSTFVTLNVSTTGNVAGVHAYQVVP